MKIQLKLANRAYNKTLNDRLALDIYLKYSAAIFGTSLAKHMAMQDLKMKLRQLKIKTSENRRVMREQRNTALHKGGAGDSQKSSVTQRLKGSLFRRK